MAKHGKRYRAARELVEAERLYEPAAAFALLKEMPAPNFDETIEAHVRLGVDPAKSDQMVRSSVVLPRGLGKSRTVLVFAEGEKVQEAEAAGADHVGMDEYIEKVGEENWLDFDVAIATPDVMSKVAKVAKVLGPRGLMPNPKTGTVTFDLEQAVSDAKAGKVEFRVDRGGNLHVPIGKRSFEPADLQANFEAFMEAVVRVKPAAAKGVYVRQIHVTGSHSPSAKVDPSSYRSK